MSAITPINGSFYGRNFTQVVAHNKSRRLQISIRVLLGVLLLTTIAAFFFKREATMAFAIPIPIVCLALVIANSYERRTRRLRISPKKANATEAGIRLVEEVTGVAMMFKIAAILSGGAFIIAASLFDWKLVSLVASVSLLGLIFLGLPFWGLIISSAKAEERAKFDCGLENT